MSNIILFVKDLKLGTEISEQIVHADHEVAFFNEDMSIEAQINSNVNMAILDLDDKEFGTVHFISTLKMQNRDLHILGYMKHVQKQIHEKLRSAGCNIILPRASITKNILTFLDVL